MLILIKAKHFLILIPGGYAHIVGEQHRLHFQPIRIQLSHVLDVTVIQNFKVVTSVGEEAQGTLTVAKTKRQQNLVSLRLEPIENAFEFHKILLSVRTCDIFFFLSAYLQRFAYRK